MHGRACACACIGEQSERVYVVTCISSVLRIEGFV